MATTSQYTPTSLAALLKNLSFDDEDDEQILNHANNVLKKYKTDASALRTKLIALIKLERYDEAIKLLDSNDVKDKIDNLELERAYCLYKVGRIADAAEVAKKGASGVKQKRGLQHVEAQSAYRLEEFQSASEIYKAISIQNPQAKTEEYDVRVNHGASKAQLVFAGHEELVAKEKTKAEDLESFETTFNAACQSIARGEYAAAAMLLKRARVICESIEEYSEEERQEELVPVISQEVYVLLKLGKVEEATKLSQNSKIRETKDVSTKSIAINNDLLITDSANPHLGQRLFGTISSIKTTTSSKPFLFQSKILDRNAATLALQTGRTNAAKSIAKSFTQKYSEDYSSSAILAAASVHDDSLNVKQKAMAKSLQELVDKSPKDIGLAFTAIQGYMQAKNTNGATQIAQRLLKALDDEPSKRYLPAVVAMVVGLYDVQGGRNGAKEELDKATAYWKDKENSNPSILLAAATNKLTSSNPQDLKIAASIFASINTKNPSPLSSAGYIAADPANTSQSQISQLTPISTLLSGINVDSLISSGVAQPSKKRALDSPTTTSTSTKQNKPTLTQPPKKKRKIHLPKGGIDPTKKPDPERWLPLRDRSTYKPKGKKDKKRLKEATQGGIATPTNDGKKDGEGDTEMIGGNSVKKVPVGQTQKKKSKGKGKK